MMAWKDDRPHFFGPPHSRSQPRASTCIWNAPLALAVTSLFSFVTQLIGGGESEVQKMAKENSGKKLLSGFSSKQSTPSWQNSRVTLQMLWRK